MAFAAIASTAGAQTSAPTQPLSLGDAARLAARQSAPVEAARLRVEQAGARVTQRRSELLPNVSAYIQQAGHTLNTATFGFDFPAPAGQPPLLNPNGQILGPVNTTDIRGRISQSIFDASALERLHTAQASAAASDAEAVSVAEQAAAGAAAAYVRVLRAEAQVAARAADSLLAEDLLRIARDQLQAGVGVGLDVTRAQSQIAGVHAQIIGARNERDRARLELLRAMHLPLDTKLELADSLASLPMLDTLPDERIAVERAVRQRPDLRAADEQIAVAERQSRAIRAERLPSVSAFVDDGAIGTAPSHMLNTYTWGIQLSLPLFDGLRRESRLEEQEAVRREIDVRRADLQQQAAVEVRGALLDLRSAREQVDAARERLRLAEQELSQARDRFRAGVAGNADVITASISLNGARTALIDALSGYQAARVGLARAEGGVTQLR